MSTNHVRGFIMISQEARFFFVEKAHKAKWATFQMLCSVFLIWGLGSLFLRAGHLNRIFPCICISLLSWVTYMLCVVRIRAFFDNPLYLRLNHSISCFIAVTYPFISGFGYMEWGTGVLFLWIIVVVGKLVPLHMT